MLTLTGCGTLAGRHQIIAVDTDPRGLPLYFKAKDRFEHRGSTPVYVEARRRFRHEFEVRSDDAKPMTQKFEMTCGVRWAGSIIPNALLTLFGGAGVYLAAVGLLTDMVNGAAFECDEVAHVKLSRRFSAPPTKKCPTVLVMPVNHTDEVVADRLRYQWTTVAAQKAGYQCATFVMNEEVRQILSYFNISHQRRVEMSELHRRQLNRLGRHVNAQQIVFLDLQYHAGVNSTGVAQPYYELNPKIYDLFDFQELDSSSYALKIEDQNQIETISQLSGSAIFFKFTPNALTWGASSQLLGTPKTSVHSGYKLEHFEYQRALPSVLTGFGVDTVEHPAGYSAWDFKWSLYPSIGFNYQEMNYRFRHVNAPEGALVIMADEASGLLQPSFFDYRLRFYYALPAINTGPTFHTPIGAFGIHLSMGPMFMSVHDSRPTNRQALRLAIGIRTVWYAFISENIFMHAETQNYSIGRDPLNAPYNNLTSFASSTIGIGYYLPQVRSSMRRTMHETLGF